MIAVIKVIKNIVLAFFCIESPNITIEYKDWKNIPHEMKGNTASIAFLDDLAGMYDVSLPDPMDSYVFIHDDHITIKTHDCSGNCQTGIECPNCDQKITWH